MYLEVMDLKKSYGTGEGRQEVLKGVGFGMEQGATASIIGSSGSGKSTLLNCIGALEVFDEGDIRIDGKSLKGLGKRSRGEYRRSNIGYIFQFFNLLPDLFVFILDFDQTAVLVGSFRDRSRQCFLILGFFTLDPLFFCFCSSRSAIIPLAVLTEAKSSSMPSGFPFPSPLH